MKNLELLKSEYVEFIKRIEEVNIKIAEIVDVHKEIKRYPKFTDDEDWGYIYTLHDYDFWYEEAKETIDISNEEYDKIIEEAVQLRNELFEEKHRIRIEFEEWKYKHKNELDPIDYREIREWYKPFTIKWRGWDSSDYVYETMIYSINLTDIDEVNELINNMRKIIDMIIKYDEEHNIEWGFDYETLEFVDYLEIVNTHTRFRKNEYCHTTMALDIMENHYVYEPFEESFKDCICNVCKYVDNEFLRMVRRTQQQE